MAVNLPLGLLSEIARILHHDSVCLIPYTTVCRQWQTAFEPIIYSDLIVYSDETHKDDGQEGISLAHLQKLTTGAGAMRRAYIRTLRYDILVPFELLDWITCKREPIEQYSMANSVREANDWAFQTAIIDIFRKLSLWEQNHRLSLDLGLRGRRVGEKPTPEPNTSYSSIAGDYRHDFTTGRTDAVPPYRARLHNNDASVLAYASCVGKLSFTNKRVAYNALGECRHRYHQIWAGTVAQIFQHCPAVTELYLNLDEWVRPDHLDYIQARREAVSELFSNAPRSLRVLHYTNQSENPWKDSLPALNVLSTEVDTLAINLQGLSISLRELKLEYTSLTLDFLWPLDNVGHPLSSTASLNWPNLTRMEFNYVPPWLPSGQWLALPTPDDQEQIDKIEDWEEEICDWESGCVDRSTNDDEQFHRFFISLGYAARHMPLLRSIEFELNHNPTTSFNFKRDSDTTTAKWESDADPEYRPDERVAKAWGFQLKDMEITGPWDLQSIVRFAYWPPQEV
ncbi:hypothetical protein F9C07_2166166 [Aspergillus flavus]|uniref:F-box domain-containing protein n=1 Tax=Aspergillus flavus (strain ATCC 200026 / FGSC A1120 / IAM 13836 / NRRL 3357 / JCM 12722 / SRRC 167) TaxID=332952 RepID=A0A7U2MJK3_ASPFN|nr:hypothetical protein F9C07_2166166 [Aspergillus flavus]